MFYIQAYYVTWVTIASTMDYEEALILAEEKLPFPTRVVDGFGRNYFSTFFGRKIARFCGPVGSCGCLSRIFIQVRQASSQGHW